MSTNRLIFLALPFALLIWWKHQQNAFSDGRTLSAIPEQGEVQTGNRKTLLINERVIESLATYKVQARVLGKESYWFDNGAKVSPLDFALGWGPMSDGNVLKHLRISQNGRFYYVSWSSSPPIAENEIMQNSANVHLIPENDYIKKLLSDVREGDLIELQGDLVMVSDKSGGEWKSSLTRDDRGDGACELMLVKQVRKL